MRIKLFHLFLISVTSLTAIGQEFRKGPIIVCPVDPNSYDTHVHMRKDISYLMDRTRSKRSSPKSNIIVNYNGFTEEAQTAFQFAVDIWENLLPSDVEIIIDANFADLGAGVLGSAGPTFLVRDFKNAPSDTTFYHIALAEKLAGEQLNLEGQSEVSCSFSSTFDFYFGTDGNTPSDQFDFVTIVLHELGHGLGFSGASGYDNGIGTWDYFNLKTARYNQFVEISDGTSITDITNGTIQTGSAIVGGNLYFNGERTVETLGERARLYAPGTYNGGSSFSHLDEAEYPAGNENSLMSPQVGRGESIFDPGVSLDLFADMGWFITLIDHSVDRKIVDNFTDNILVEVELRSDTNIVSNNIKVVYSDDGFSTSNQITLSDDGNNLYSASIPNPGESAEIQYYFDGVSDGLGRDVRSPLPSNSYHSVFVRDVATESLPFTSAGDFESGDAGFFSVSLVGDIDLWELGSPGNTLTTSSTPTNVWKTNLSGDIDPGNATYSCALVTPYFDLSDDGFNYVLSFDLGMELGKRAEDDLLFDGGPIGANMEVTTDGGQTWEVLGIIEDQAGDNWYNFQNNGGGTFSTNLFDNDPGWVIDSLNSVEVSYNISRLAGNSEVGFRIVFYVESDFLDEGYETDGVLVDDFEITSGNPIADFVLAEPRSSYFPGESIEFEYISSGATSYLWDFGDGNSSTDENPTHSYSAGGAYDVTLTINYSGGSDAITKESFVAVFAESGPNYSLTDGGNFEVDNGDFVVENVTGTGLERGNSDIEGKDGTSSGDFAWVTGIEADEYENNSEAFLFTPIFDFSLIGNYSISFMTNYDTEVGWDGYIIEYSNDLGDTWSQLAPEVDDDWYDVIGEDNPSQGWPAIPLFTGDTDGYVEKQRDISSIGGEGQIIFRFHWISDGALTEIGFAIDDFELTGPVPGPAVAEFSIANATGCEGQVVTFSNESTGSISAIEWDFGANATPATATGVGPHDVTYSGTGSSTVTLTVTSPINGEQIEEKVDVITTSPSHEPTIEQTYNGDGTYTLRASAGDSYQWLRDGEVLDGETNRELTVNLGDGGEFSALVTVGSCEVEAESLIVNSVIENTLVVYPNPTSDFITINAGIQLNGQYSIYNTSGKVIEADEINSNELIVDMSRFEDGLYILRMDVNNEIIIREIIIRQ